MGCCFRRGVHGARDGFPLWCREEVDGRRSQDEMADGRAMDGDLEVWAIRIVRADGETLLLGPAAAF